MKAVIFYWTDATVTLILFFVNISVGGTYITVRGCAPFDSETFNQGMQRQMVGSYWKGLNVFSLCDHDQCNNGNSITTNLVLSALIAIIMQYLF